MNSLFLSCSAAGCASLSNLFFRKGSAKREAATSANGFLFVYYLICFLCSFIIYPEIFSTTFSYSIFVMGACVGLLNVSVMYLMAQAMRTGPSGTTFAFQNASAVFPGVVLFMFFGAEFGFTVTMTQLLGVALVVLGLFLGTRGSDEGANKANGLWLKYVLCCFVAQIMALTFMQGRCLLFDCDIVMKEADVWFMPGLFGVALFAQGVQFWREKRKLDKGEVIFGSLGGLANFVATCLLLGATKYAAPIEKGLVFPLYSVGTIILCNAWATKLYQEKFQLLTNILCAVGMFIALM